MLNRIKQYIDSKNIKVSAFEKSLGMANATFGKSLKNGGSIGCDKLEKILNTYPDINLYWLVTGNGAMLKEEKVEDLSLEVLAKERCENCNTLERLIKNQDERIKELKDTIEILKKK